MDTAHVHLLINHLPIIGAFLSVLLLAIALWRRTERGTLLSAVLVLLLTGGGALLAETSGEVAEEAVEGLPWYDDAMVHEHEERAEVATPLAVVTALAGLGLLGWAWRRGETPLVPGGIVLGAAAVTAAAMAWTGVAGGEIRHDEIRGPVAPISSVQVERAG